jgi:hypothetical protein
MSLLSKCGWFLVSMSLSALASAQNVSVTNAWARASVKGQNATGVFMSLKASQKTKLVSVSSSVAAVTQVHQMSMDNNVMKMSALPNGLDLNAGSVVDLKPGGYHIMLMDLKKTLEKDSQIDLQLTFQDAAGKKTQMELKVPVLMQAAMTEGAGMSQGADHMHH